MAPARSTAARQVPAPRPDDPPGGGAAPAGSGLTWVKTPAQGRSQQTLERILDACARLLDERPFDQVSVHDIVKKAGASVGSFYARFSTKDDLLHALHERYVVESEATTRAALSPDTWEGVPMPRVLEQVVTFVVAFQRENLGLRRALIVATADQPVFRARNVKLASFVVDQAARLLAARRDEVAHPSVDRAADFLHRMIFSVLDQTLLFAPDSPTGRPLSDEELTKELVRACLGYLGAPASTPLASPLAPPSSPPAAAGPSGARR